MTVQPRRRAPGGRLYGTAVTGGTIILGGGSPRSGRGPRKAQNTPYSYPATASPAAKVQGGSKIIVNNLHNHVTEADLKELFSTQIAPLRRVMLNFDASGKSRGVAEITFRGNGDAAVACQRFNKVLLDGRPMNIEIVLQPNQVRRKIVVGPLNDAKHNGNGRKPNGARGRGQGGLRQSGHQTRGPPKGRPQKTAEELDAEMAAYMSAAMPTVLDEDVAM